MICLNCNAFIENGNYKCRKCNTVFNEADVQVMLSNERRALKKQNAKRLRTVLLLLTAIAVLLSVIFYYSLKRFKEVAVVSDKIYQDSADDYLKSMSDVVKYEHDGETVMIMVDTDAWSAITATEQQDFTMLLQQNLTKLRYEAGVKRTGFVTVQIVNDEDELLIYANEAGELTYN